MLDGVNDSPAQARELARLLQRPAGQGQPDSVQSVPGHALPPLAPAVISALPRPAAQGRRHGDRSAARAATTSTRPAASWSGEVDRPHDRAARATSCVAQRLVSAA